ncbi:hypothetical protein JYU09_01470 [bacterium AH-315-O15]|nr:hypothetical protein [bacterium AH-315-O15]
MFKDRSGTYRPFVLGNMSEDRSVTDTDRIAQRRRMITTVCESATLALNPSFSKSTPTRHRATESCGVIVLPATTTNGIHLHGFIRSPRAHPGAVQVVAAALMIAFKTKNIWVSDVTELQQNGASLAYLTDTWKLESRDWSALEFLPAHYFKRLTGNANDQFPQNAHHAVA